MLFKRICRPSMTEINKQKKNLSYLLRRMELIVILLLLLINCTPKHKESNKWVGQLRPEYTTILGVTVGYPSFQELIKIFGKANQYERQGNVWLCYRSKTSHNTIAVLFARPVRHDDVDSIFVFQYAALADRLKEYCVTSNKIPNSIRVGDLALGMTREEIYKKWGDPRYLYLNDNLMVYTYYAGEKVTDELRKKLYPESMMKPFISPFHFVYISSSVRFLFKDNKLVEFGIYRDFLPTDHEYFPNESNSLKP